jgi:outer membrane protein
MLKIAIQDKAGSRCLKLEGKLNWPWVLILEQCLCRLEKKDDLIIDLTDVEFVDTAGRYLLALLKERGARFITGSPLIEEIFDVPAHLSAKSPGSGRVLGVILLFACLLSAGGRAVAQEAPIPLDLAQTATLARSRNLQIRADRQAEVTAKSAVDQAKALRYGKVAVDASYLRLDDPVTIESGPVHLPFLGGITLAVPPVFLAPADLAHVRLEAGLPLFTGGKISNAIAAARNGQKAAEALSDDTEAAVILDSCRLYLGTLLARDVVKLNEQAMESYRRHLEDARTAYRMGVVANYDVIRAEAAVADQEKRLTEARNRRELLEAALKTALNLDSTTRLDVQGALFEPPAPQALAEMQAAAMKGNPGLEAMRKRQEALERAVRMEKGDYLPQIMAVAGKETVTSKLSQTDPDWFVGVRATWTLFDGGARRARVAARASEAERARIEARHAEDQVLLAVRSALLDYEAQKSALASAQKTAVLARESLRLATKRFAAGAGTSLEVLDANVTLTAAETGERNALYQMDEAYLRIHRFIGDISEIAAGIQQGSDSHS